MNTRTNTFLKAALLAGLGMMFYTKISSGSLGLYINPRFFWLPYVGFVVLMAFAVNAVYQAVFSTNVIRTSQIGQIAPAKNISTERPPRRLGTNSSASSAVAVSIHSHVNSWWVPALLIMPIILGLALPSTPLSSSALATRGLSSVVPRRLGVTKTQALSNKADKNVLDWLQTFAIIEDKNLLVDKPVDLIGFVHYDTNRLGENEFWVSRYIVSCCVSDANGVGLIARSASKLTHEEGEWVRVRGKMRIGKFNDQEVPLIDVTSIETTATPANPYLSP
jgi:uncharacterized repeat protein (TIGR03943 family)